MPPALGNTFAAFSATYAGLDQSRSRLPHFYCGYFFLLHGATGQAASPQIPILSLGSWGRVDKTFLLIYKKLVFYLSSLYRPKDSSWLLEYENMPACAISSSC